MTRRVVWSPIAWTNTSWFLWKQYAIRRYKRQAIRGRQGSCTTPPGSGFGSLKGHPTINTLYLMASAAYLLLQERQIRGRCQALQPGVEWSLLCPMMQFVCAGVKVLQAKPRRE